MNKTCMFKNLHNTNKPVLLLNIWNKDSAEVLAKKGINLFATSSYAMANNFHYDDGENMPFSELLNHCHEISTLNGLLTVDIESGYAQNINQLQENIRELLQLDIVGINIEDKLPESQNLNSIQEQCSRINAIKKVCELIGKDIFINVRTDVYFCGDVTNNNQNDSCLNEATKRIIAYKNAGADGVFIPGLKNIQHLKTLAKVDIPINIMLDIETDTIEDYLNIGISRISVGPSVYRLYCQSKQKNIDITINQVLQKLNKLKNLIHLYG